MEYKGNSKETNAVGCFDVKRNIKKVKAEVWTFWWMDGKSQPHIEVKKERKLMPKYFSNFITAMKQ